MGSGLLERYLSWLADLQISDNRRGQGIRPTWLAYLPVVLVAALGVTVTIASLIQSLRWEKRQVEITFREASQDRILAVQRELTYSFGRVQDIASLFGTSATVGRREFRKFVGPALKSHSSIKALAWAPVVPIDDTTEFLKDVRRSFPPFQIREFGPADELIEETDHPISYPVLYIQPYRENKAMLGLNIGAEPMIAPLLSQAELTQSMQVSPGASIPERSSEKEEILAVLPVFFEDEPTEDNAPPSSSRLKGFAIGIFYFGEIVEQALSTLRPAGIHLHFYLPDANGDRRRLYTHQSRLRKHPGFQDLTSAMTFKDQIFVGDQSWEVVCNPSPGQFATEVRNSWIMFAGGLAFTALLSVYVATLIGRARQVRREVDVRTSQLWETVQALNREVTERKSAERELQTLNETLEDHIASRTAEADRRAQYLEQFAYVTSHDLKAPLRAVSNLAGWIEEDLSDKLDDSSREQLMLLRDRVSRMHNLIEGLLEYSRVGKTSDTVNPVDTRELIIETIDSLSPPKGFKIKIQGEMPTLYADRLQLGQVFANLISNSLKHHGGEKGKIRIGCENRRNFYEFSLCDNGQGIAPEYHDKVFMMFQTLASRDTENSTGIGLALVKKIVEEHGGKVRLESALGEGVCVYFTWPNKAPAKSGDQP